MVVLQTPSSEREEAPRITHGASSSSNASRGWVGRHAARLSTRGTPAGEISCEQYQEMKRDLAA